MATPTLLAAFARFRDRACAADPGAGDAALLEAFTRRRDESAFETLLQRHGPLVWSACLRHAADRHAAEDAFQATFLALARRADRLAGPRPLAGWLYTVAVRFARKTHRFAHRHRSGDVETSTPATALDELTGREVLTAVDEELLRLPERYRLPLLLCCLQGLARDDAAARLGLTFDALKGRLERGRERLRRRLEGRGIALPSALALLAAADAEGASPELLRQTARLALGESAPPAVAALTQSAGPALSRRLITAALLTCCAAGLAAVGGVEAPRVKPPERPQAEAKPEPPVTPKADNFGDPLPPGALMRFGTLRFRAARTSFAVTSDGKIVAVGGERGTMVFGAATGRVITVLPQALMPEEMGESRVSDFALSPDQKTLYAAGKRPFLRAWDLTTFAPSFSINEPVRWNIAVAASPDGKTVAAGHEGQQDGALMLLDAATGKTRATVQRPGGVLGLAFAKDGRLAAAGAGRVSLHDPHTGKEVASFDTPCWARKIAFHPDGKSLWVTQERSDNEKRTATVMRLDATTGRELSRFDVAPGMCLSLAVSGDGKSVAAGTHLGVVTLFDVPSGKKHDFVPHQPMGGVAFDPDGKRLFAAGCDGCVRVFDVVTRRQLNADDEPAGAFGSAVLSPDETRVAAASGAKVHIWDARSGRLMRAWDADDKSGLKSIHFTPDGKALLTSGWDTSVRLWNVDSGAEVRLVGQCARTNTGAALSPDGTIVAAPWPEAGTITLFETATGRRLRACAGGAKDHNKLQFSADSRLLAGASEAAVRVWNVATGSIVHEFPVVSPNGVAISPDGRLLAALAYPPEEVRGLPDEVRGPRSAAVLFWDVASGQELIDRRLPTGWMPTFSPDGRFLAVTGRGGLKLIELATGEVARTIPSALWNVTGLTFSRDGRRLLAAYSDGFALLWDLTPPQPQTDPARWWDALAADAAAAWRATTAMTSRPAEALALLRDKLRPAGKQAPVVPTAKLVSELDANEFARREAAGRELLRRAHSERAELQAARAAAFSPEVRKRLDAILRASASPWAGLTRDELRELRAVAVLEHLSTPEARALLKELAAGAPGARLTHHAADSLRRAEVLK